MQQKHQKGSESISDLQESVERLSSELEGLEGRVKKQERNIRTLSGRLEKSAEREGVLMEALSLDEKSKKGDRGFLNEMSESILHFEEYLLRNSERIDTILVTLKNHREMLMKMNDVYFRSGERDRIKLELSIMRNTVSIMALAGIDLDVSLLREIKAVQATLGSKDLDLSELKKSKEKLDKRFDGELKRFDLESLYLKKRDIPGYG